MTTENLTNLIARIEKLEKAVFAPSVKEKKLLEKTPSTNQGIDFSLNERAFVSRYAADKSGPKRFTLLLAYFAKGEVDKSIELSEIKKHWEKMSAKTLLGKFNMFYPNDAKTRGWVDSKKHGNYNLTNAWKEVL